MKGGDGRWLSSPRPRTRVWLCRSRRTAAPFPLSLSSVHSRCLPHRTAAARGGVSPLSRPALSFRSASGVWCASRPPASGEGERPASASRAALSPWLPGARAGRSRRRARGRDRARRRGGGPPSRVFHPPTPVRVPSYRVPARRFKDPRGGRLSVPGVGGTEGPVGSRRRPAAPADSRSSRGGRPFPRRAAAVVGSGAPSRAPVGLASACPVRRCVVGRGPRVRRSRPALLVFLSLSRWPARGEPLSVPPPPLSGGGGWRGGLCRRQLSLSERKKRSYDS